MYASCTLQVYYGISEMEALGVVWAIKYFHPYLYGQVGYGSSGAGSPDFTLV